MEIPVDFPPEISASLLHCTRDPFLVWCLTSNFSSSDFSEESFSLFFYLFSFLFFSFLTIFFHLFRQIFFFFSFSWFLPLLSVLPLWSLLFLFLFSDSFRDLLFLIWIRSIGRESVLSSSSDLSYRDFFILQILPLRRVLCSQVNRLVLIILLWNAEESVELPPR